MKSITLAIICVLMLNSCKKKSEEQPEIVPEIEAIEYASFGKKIIVDDAIAATSMASHYKTMNTGDSINSKMIAKVNSVCQAKGCWMTLNLEDGNEVMVKFKDYGFFVPKDIAGKEVVINGKAYIKEVTIDELRHYAEDAGKSAKDIAAITEPKRTYSFEADGVLLKQ
ncbi:DUF4920 domain-containing protein [Flavivirga spongiicola]|uniref:DUF4920 domain-containing protein n=1 Tax=Flavivirga spongiicola TaxID=421621 RepID=A0ABU7XQ58_9FLAO|nr:DUF4920 domain-containing protein [Flavivirga sp. MEBiC05379]MDO5977583.1 DUF4920 domain-containing protein [Flavivirga sp. MEBiC05379]